ncbi:DENN domain and WD repeat-containing protein SCD1-like isoform X1 [Rosa rugosa]|uniref:DENN domain and WD repeat-containing protein SCD1-like isoform X1 n=1 Tax=Rosa rugosa TaxID=74645 RepID=UPI002B40D59A|nr:DENN domain and WD repeat-containing protein SCD1-like isoform X1 [Rosa rugosa]
MSCLSCCVSFSMTASLRSANYASLVTDQLSLVELHMAGLGLPDLDAWYMIETIAEKNNIGYTQFIKLRGLLSHVQQLRIGYWGISSFKAQSMSHGLASPRSKDAAVESQQPAEASGVGRSWVQSMFSRDNSTRLNSFSRVRKWTSDGGSPGISVDKISCLHFMFFRYITIISCHEATNENGTSRKRELSAAGQKKTQTNVRVRRGHTGPITALHCVTRREVWDLVGDREDAGFFISGSRLHG